MAEQDVPPAYSHAQRLRRQLADTTAVERATGVVMHQTGATADTARAQLARDAARTGRTLPRHCAHVLADVTGTSARAGTAPPGPRPATTWSPPTPNTPATSSPPPTAPGSA